MRSTKVHTTGLCLLVALPLIVVICVAVLSGSREVMAEGDAAVLELAVWHAPRDMHFVGLGSPRLGFHHPGPMYFYLLVPLYWLTGCKHVAIPLTATLINLSAIVGVLAVIWRCAGRLALTWSALLLALYVRFIGLPELVSAWTACVTILPFVLALFLFAAVATGRLGYLPAAVFVSSFVVQTHLVYASCLAVAAALSLLICASTTLRKWLGIRTSRSGGAVAILLICSAVLGLLWAPPVIQQITETPGNISEIVRFSVNRAVSHSWGESLKALLGVLSAFPRSLVAQDGLPMQQGDELAVSWILIGAQLLLMPLSYWLARRGGRDFELVLCVLFVALLAICAVSIPYMPGELELYLVWWMASLSLLLLVAIGGACLPWVGKRFRVGEIRGWRRGLSGVALVAVVLAVAASLKRVPQAVRVVRDESDISERIRPIVTASRDVLETEHVRRYMVRIIDRDVWPDAAGVVLQLTKAGWPPALDPEWAFVISRKHVAIEPIDGMFLICSSERDGRSWPRSDLKPVAETPELLLYWCPSASEVQGKYSFRDLGAFAWQYDGFWPAEGTGSEGFCWSKGSESKIVVRLDKRHTYRVTLSVAPLAVPNRTQRMSVLLNGHALAELPLRGAGPRDVEVLLPAQHVQDINEIVFRYRYAESARTVAGNRDPRKLAVRFYSLTFEPILEHAERGP